MYVGTKTNTLGKFSLFFPQTCLNVVLCDTMTVLDEKKPHLKNKSFFFL